MVQRRLGSSRAAVEWGDVLELQGLSRRYGDLVALDDLSFTVAEGQMFGFVGPNGAGKSTAMRIVLGVLKPDAGAVRWFGRPMTDKMRQRAGYCLRTMDKRLLHCSLVSQEYERRRLGRGGDRPEGGCLRLLGVNPVGPASREVRKAVATSPRLPAPVADVSAGCGVPVRPASG
jgi:ABC-type cobalamin/Fe3+-siderophores transport system ATPase subunit